MVMKKQMISSEGISIIRTSETKHLYPKGFKYMLGQTIYTVDKIVDKDPNSDMRRVVGSDGSLAIIEVESIRKDLKEADAVIMEKGEVAKKEDSEEQKNE
jgi:hypothetical protein